MRNWEKESGKDFEVPSLIDFMVDQKILEDQSWVNDAMPRFHIVDPEDDDQGVVIWVDHPVASEREHGPGGKRFLVVAGPWTGDNIEELETDDLEEAVTTAIEYSEKHIPKARVINFKKLIKNWKSSLSDF
jgi:hypothetical protein